jgi:hypothetical protein
MPHRNRTKPEKQIGAQSHANKYNARSSSLIGLRAAVRSHVSSPCFRGLARICRSGSGRNRHKQLIILFHPAIGGWLLSEGAVPHSDQLAGSNSKRNGDTAGTTNDLVR